MNIDDDELYIDQEYYNHRHVLTSYTPYGIRQMYTDYADRILKGKEDKAKLQEEIQANPHLHQTLKNNLIQNLYTR